MNFSAGAGAFTLTGNSITLTEQTSGYTIRNFGTNLQTINLDLILGRDTVVHADQGDIHIGGTISGNYALIKDGAKALTLSVANSHTGGTSIWNGALNVNHANAVGSGTLTFYSPGATLDNTSGAPIILTNTLYARRSWVFGGSNDMTLTGNLTTDNNGASRAITTNGTAVLTLAGSVSHLAGAQNQTALNKQGNGTLRLSGNTTVSKSTTGLVGVAVSAGTLLIDGSLTSTNAGMSRLVEVNTGATLGGTGGTLNMDISVVSGGTLAPGTATGIGTINVTGNTTLAGGGAFALSLNASALTTDLLAVDGNISLATDNTTVLSLNVLSDAPVVEGQIFTFLTYTGSWNNGLFTYNSSVLNEGDTFSHGANNYKISYGVEVANAFTLEAIPEPGIVSLIFCAGALVLWNLRRKTRRLSA